MALGSAPAADLCKDCIDPYASTTERGKFFKAAGVDSELTADEFKADQARKDGFVRKFDTWPGMLAFDKNGNKTMDWFEMNAYRLAFRKQVLAAYDKNKDERLAGAEREAAIKALEGGTFRLRIQRTPITPAPRPGDRRVPQPGAAGDLLQADVRIEDEHLPEGPQHPALQVAMPGVDPSLRGEANRVPEAQISSIESARGALVEERRRAAARRLA